MARRPAQTTRVGRAFADQARWEAFRAALDAERGACGSAIIGLTRAYDIGGQAKGRGLVGDDYNRLNQDLYKHALTFEERCMVNASMLGRGRRGRRK